MNAFLTEVPIIFNKSKKTVICAFLVAFTLVLEEVFQKVVFRCPCDNHQSYGLLFLLGPAVFLFVVGILVDPNTWRLLNAMGHPNRRKQTGRRKCCRIVFTIGKIFTKALLSPLVWLILCFLQKAFYVCAMFGPIANNVSPPAKGRKKTFVSCSPAKNSKLHPGKLYTEAQVMASSQMIGILLLIVSILGILIAAVINKCRRCQRNLRLPDETYYKQIEAKAAAKGFHKWAKLNAQNQGRQVLENIVACVESEKKQDYLSVLNEVGSMLDNQYSQFYDSALHLAEIRRQRNTENQYHDEPLSPECFIQEDSFFVVDGNVTLDSKLRVVNDVNEEFAVSGDVSEEIQVSQTEVCLKRTLSTKLCRSCECSSIERSPLYDDLQQPTTQHH